MKVSKERTIPLVEPLVIRVYNIAVPAVPVGLASWDNWDN
jgi:hypothetical protein